MALSYKQSAYEHIRQRMLEGSLKAGDPLPYRELAREVGISATPVREAISRLESEGLVDQLPRVGAFVKRMDRVEVKELYELREALEGHAAALAADSITGDQLRELESLYRQMQKLVAGRKSEPGWDIPELRDQMALLDVKFHLLIVEAACNRRIAKAVGDYRLMSKLCGVPRNDPRKVIEWSLVTTVRDHSRVFRAIYKRDTQAARFWMQRHIALAKIGALEMFDQSLGESGVNQSVVWSESIRHTIAQMERYTGNSRPRR
jgi:DNA-binding GntR family transcriptional regulator